MPRRNQATIRVLEPDSLYRSRLVQQVINKVMVDGKKSVAEQITYDALALVGERTGNNPVEELEGSIKQLTPVLEVRSRRVGGATYQVPLEVPARRARPLAVRWRGEFARARGEKSMAERLANEILDASKQQGNAWKRKDDIYRMAQANKAFAHYRWQWTLQTIAWRCLSTRHQGSQPPHHDLAGVAAAPTASRPPPT